MVSIYLPMYAIYPCMVWLACTLGSPTGSLIGPRCWSGSTPAYTPSRAICISILATNVRLRRCLRGAGQDRATNRRDVHACLPTTQYLYTIDSTYGLLYPSNLQTAPKSWQLRDGRLALKTSQCAPVPLTRLRRIRHSGWKARIPDMSHHASR